MYEVDYYIHGAQSQRNSIKELLLTTTLSTAPHEAASGIILQYLKKSCPIF